MYSRHDAVAVRADDRGGDFRRAVAARARRGRRLRAGSDVAVYRDQIDEIARDRDAGLIGEAEADAARVEVSRRLLAAADAAAKPRRPPAGRPCAAARRRSACWSRCRRSRAALYLALGSPELPGQPLAEPRRDAACRIARSTLLVAQVEAHLESNPDDGRGWEVIAPVYLRLGRFEDAVKARRNALRLNGASADREADLGEALIGAGERHRDRRGQGGLRARADARCAEARQGALLPRRRGPAGRAGAQAPRRSGARCWPTRRPIRPGSAMVRAGAWRASEARFGRPGRAPTDVAAAEQMSAGGPRRDDPRHGRAAGRTAEARRLGRRGLAAAGARLYGAGRPRPGAVRRRRRAPRARPRCRQAPPARCAGERAAAGEVETA